MCNKACDVTLRIHLPADRRAVARSINQTGRPPLRVAQHATADRRRTLTIDIGVNRIPRAGANKPADHKERNNARAKADDFYRYNSNIYAGRREK